jgi:hypothetical protein
MSYEYQVGSNEACSQNFSFQALNTTELSAPQISSKNPRQRCVTDGKKIASETKTFHFSYEESKNKTKIENLQFSTCSMHLKMLYEKT